MRDRQRSQEDGKEAEAEEAMAQLGDIAGERPGQGGERQETKESRREKARVRRGGYVEEEKWRVRKKVAASQQESPPW